MTTTKNIGLNNSLRKTQVTFKLKHKGKYLY